MKTSVNDDRDEVGHERGGGEPGRGGRAARVRRPGACGPAGARVLPGAHATGAGSDTCVRLAHGAERARTPPLRARTVAYRCSRRCRPLAVPRRSSPCCSGSRCPPARARRRAGRRAVPGPVRRPGQPQAEPAADARARRADAAPRRRPGAGAATPPRAGLEPAPAAPPAARAATASCRAPARRRGLVAARRRRRCSPAASSCGAAPAVPARLAGRTRPEATERAGAAAGGRRCGRATSCSSRATSARARRRSSAARCARSASPRRSRARPSWSACSTTARPGRSRTSTSTGSPAWPTRTRACSTRTSAPDTVTFVEWPERAESIARARAAAASRGT